MTMDDRLIWRKQDIAIRRAPFILSDEMKLKAEKTLRRAADVLEKAGGDRIRKEPEDGRPHRKPPQG